MTFIQCEGRKSKATIHGHQCREGIEYTGLSLAYKGTKSLSQQRVWHIITFCKTSNLPLISGMRFQDRTCYMQVCRTKSRFLTLHLSNCFISPASFDISTWWKQLFRFRQKVPHHLRNRPSLGWSNKMQISKNKFYILFPAREVTKLLSIMWIEQLTVRRV